MEWTEVTSIIGANIGLMIASIGSTLGLFLWCRHEAGEDRKIVNDDRKEILHLIREIRADIELHKRETDQKMFEFIKERK